MDIIKPVSEPTEWVNSRVSVEKTNSSLHIYLGTRNLNKAITWERFQLHTAEEIYPVMHDTKYFSNIGTS